MKISAYILTIVLFARCGAGYRISELYIQKVQNSDKSIYQYDAWSTVNDGAKYGLTVLGINEAIGIRDAERMPFDYFLLSPTRDTFFVVELKDGGTKIPKYISTEISNFKGIVLKTEYYAYEIGTSHNLTYKFSNFRETDDSLIILGLEKVYFNFPTSKNEIGFRKGNIKLVESDTLKGVIKRIEIPAFLVKDFNRSSIDNLAVFTNDSLNITGLVGFEFEPTRPINSNEFSDFGIYKKREIKDEEIVQ